MSIEHRQRVYYPVGICLGPGSSEEANLASWLESPLGGVVISASSLVNCCSEHSIHQSEIGFGTMCVWRDSV